MISVDGAKCYGICAARAAGFRALTSRYNLPDEQWMLDNVLADMRRANVNHVLVKERGGVAVWRSWRTAIIPTAKPPGRGATDAAARRRGRVAA